MRYRVRFKVSVITALLLIITSLTIVTLGNVWLISSRTAEETASRLFESATERTRQRLDRLADEMLVLANLGASEGESKKAPSNGLSNASLPLLIAGLKGNPSLYSLYFGFDDGSFFQVISTQGETRILTAHGAPKETRWIVRTISPQAVLGQPVHSRTETYIFLDPLLREIGKSIDHSPNYDPRKRPWYKSAAPNSAPHFSAPYVFNSLKKPGLTASKRLEGGGGVFGVDVTLTNLSNFISSLDVSENGGIILMDENNNVLSMASQFGEPLFLAPIESIRSKPIQALILAQKKQTGKGLQIIKTGGAKIMVRLSDWSTSGRLFQIAAVAPMSDFVGHIRAMQTQIIGFILLGLGVFIPVSLIYSNRMSKSLLTLTNDANRLRNLDFSGESYRSSRIVEFDELGQSFTRMKTDLSARTRELEVADKKLTRLVELGIAMSAEHDSDRLMEMILQGAKELTNAEGGSLYTIGDDNALHFQIIQGNDVGHKFGDEARKDNNFPPVPLLDELGKPNHQNVVSYSVHEGKTVNIPDAYNSDDFDFSGTREFDERNKYHSVSFLTVPLRPRGGDIIGALQLINALDPETGTPIPFPEEVQMFVEALAAQAATALYNRNLLDAQTTLLDSMIQLIASAVDTKSPYTGGHCARVPELAFMLAEQACDADKGPLADFNFNSDAEWREFRIGAWLHDCGKIVTPEYVIDKATKLETIYNRIHEVRMRFEVLLRDAEIKRLKTVIAGGDPKESDRLFEQQKLLLEEEFSFIADSNIGGEFMDEAAVERVKEIGEKTWLRHFDDRVGLSHFEISQYSSPALELPVTERLLDDKPHHIIERHTDSAALHDELGFKMTVPEHLYDNGEIKNLSISRGTLTEEERFKINEHITQTIAMLENLPFPKHLKRVPEYAGTHHESLNGEGYPRKLTANELSIPARIMAIADIFEALTASDRPYKKAKSLSESIKILSFFKKDGHIDPDLFDLFLTSGVYKNYADLYLDPDQIDKVDITQYTT